MPRNYFAILGLAPGQYDPAEITKRFQRERERLLQALSDPRSYARARRQLDDLHLAYAALRRPQAQAAVLAPPPAAEESGDVARLRRMIAASLEDGLLRYSRRRDILAAAQELGFSDFQTQLLIAQVQFGDDQIPFGTGAARRQPASAAARAWAGATAVGVLAMMMFFVLMHWLAG
ncbi:MAG: hypothetical protein PVJ57_07025 [Phycisphaerae bacterium]|jgi:hypothetical protein